MSNAEVNADVEEAPRTASLPDEYVRLERSVRRLMDDLAGYRARAEVAERKAADLKQALEGVSSGALDPIRMRESLGKLEAENKELRGRMVQAQDRIRRLIARFDFLREEM